MGMAGRLDYLLGEKRDLGQRLRAAKRERDDVRNRVKFLVR